MTKIKKSSNEYKENIRRLRLLGIKETGSWGPVQQKLWEKYLDNFYKTRTSEVYIDPADGKRKVSGIPLKLTHPEYDILLFGKTIGKELWNGVKSLPTLWQTLKSTPLTTSALIAGTTAVATASSVGANTASKKITGRTVGENVEHYSGGYIPKFVGDYYTAAYPSSKFLSKTTPYFVSTAAREELLSLAKASPTPSELINYAKRIVSPNRKIIPDVKVISGRGSNESATQIKHRKTSKAIVETDNKGVSTAGSIYVIPEKQGTTIEVHANPKIYYSLDENRRATGIIGSNPSPDRNTIENFVMNAPRGTHISYDSRGATAGQIVAKLPFTSQLKYVFTGKYPQVSIENVEGFSTDIMRAFSMLPLRYPDKFLVVPSVTTRSNGTNIFGKSYPKLKDYFGETDGWGNLPFNNMTETQVNNWNTKFGLLYNLTIDANRTTPQLILIKK